jgi:hypothetical protein
LLTTAAYNKTQILGFLRMSFNFIFMI